MTIGIGIGLGRFPMEKGPDYFDWVRQCELGGIDSIWQTDRLVSNEPNLETLSTMAALAGATGFAEGSLPHPWSKTMGKNNAGWRARVIAHA